MSFTLRELASLCGGEIVGNPDLSIKGAASLMEAGEGDITFFGDPRYALLLRKTQASAIFVSNEFAEDIPQSRIKVANPAKAFEQVVLKLAPDPVRFEPGLHPSAVIDSSASLGEKVCVQAQAVIEAGVKIGAGSVVGAGCFIGRDSVVGPNALIYPNVTIRERTIIGDRVIIHSGAVVGADGFGFEMVEGRYVKIPQLGFVQIDDDVELGANTTVDRGRFGRTWIRSGVKIDNLVQVAHNVVIGEHTAIAALTGIAGSVRIGRHVVIAGQVGLAGHVEVADQAIIGAQAGVTKNIGPGPWLLSPAIPFREAKQQVAWLHRLGKLFARVKALEKKLGD